MPFDAFNENGDPFGGGDGIGPQIVMRVTKADSQTMIMTIPLSGDWNGLWDELRQPIEDYLGDDLAWRANTYFGDHLLCENIFIGMNDPNEAIENLKVRVLEIPGLTSYLYNIPEDMTPKLE